MQSPARFVSAAALAIVLSPFALAANSQGDAFMQKAIKGNLAEIKVGQLAQQKGSTEAVRHLGAVLMRDHSKANDKATAAMSSMGETPPTEPGRAEQAEYARLAALSGRSFDRAFVKAMIMDHEKNIAAYREEAKAGSGEAAAYAKASLSTLEKHLHLAESLERRTGG